jgi:hypothetical protein
VCPERSSTRENQYISRRANERLLHAVDGKVRKGRSIPFLCECLDPECHSTIQLTVEQFRGLREQPRRFAIVKGHPMMEGERVVETTESVAIVEKEAISPGPSPFGRLS